MSDTWSIEVSSINWNHMLSILDKRLQNRIESCGKPGTYISKRLSWLKIILNDFKILLVKII